MLGESKVQGNLALARQCYLMASQVKPSNAFLVKGLDTKDELAKKRKEPVEDLVATPLHDGNPQHIVQISSKLDEAAKQ